MINQNVFHFNYEFLDEYDNFCIHNNIKLLLDNYQVENSFAYIDTSVGVRFTLSEAQPEKLEVVYSIDKTSAIEPFDKLVHIIYPKDKTDSKGTFEAIKKELDAGEPVITLVDVYDLKYLPFYHGEHSIHSIILCGYDESNEEVILVDWYKPYFYKGTLKLDDFYQARASENPESVLMNSGYPIENRYLFVEHDGWNGTLPDLLSNTVDKMNGIYYGKESTRNLETAEGIGAVLKLRDLVAMFDKMPEDKVKEILPRLHRNFYIMPHYWMLLSEYMRRIADALNLEEKLAVDLVTLQMNHKLWVKFLRLIVKANLGDAGLIYPKLLKTVDEIVQNDYKCKVALDKIKRAVK